MSWRWITKRALLLLHAESLAEHGGGTGMRDEGLLDSALTRPLNLVACGSPDFAALAASYGVGFAKNSPFASENNWAALLATGLFLYFNGYKLTASQADTTITMLGVAAGDITEEAFAAWLRQHCSPRA